MHDLQGIVLNSVEPSPLHFGKCRENTVQPAYLFRINFYPEVAQSLADRFVSQVEEDIALQRLLPG